MGEEEEVQAWYYMVGDEQVGPVSAEDLQQLALQGVIHAESQLWTEGLDQWIPATNVEGLLPAEPVAQAAREPQAQAPQAQPGTPHLIIGAEAQAAHPLAGETVPQAPQVAPAQPLVAQPMATQPAQGQPLAGQPLAPQPQVAGVVPSVGGLQPAGMPTTVQPGTDYPTGGVKRASYGTLIGTLIGAVVIGLGGFALSANMSSKGPESESTAILALFVSLGVAGLLCLFGVLLACMYLYRAWHCLRFGNPRTTAGKAVGFLFIPIFNVYWVFVAIYGLAQDWNRIMNSHPNLQGAPPMSPGLFLTFIICMVLGIGAPVGIIVWFIVYKQICNGINFMVSQNLRQHHPGTMSFY